MTGGGTVWARWSPLPDRRVLPRDGTVWTVRAASGLQLWLRTAAAELPTSIRNMWRIQPSFSDEKAKNKNAATATRTTAYNDYDE